MAPVQESFSKEPNASATLTFVVTEQDTASALGSGDLEVLATPRVLAWFEAATCLVAQSLIRADASANAQTSVGTRVSLDHLSATSVGQSVVVRADLEHRDGRLLRFAVTALAGTGAVLVATGQVTRVIVDRERFLNRLRGR